MTSEPAATAASAPPPAPPSTSPNGIVIAERRQHPAYLLIAAGQTIRALIPLIAVSVFAAPWWVFVLLGAVVVAVAVTSWLTSTYAVSDGELRVRSGLIARKLRSVPVSRITAAEAKRGVTQRLLGVWALKLQTPGDGSRASVTLHSLTRDQLDDLLWAVHPQGGRDRPVERTSHLRAVLDMPGSADAAARGQVVARLDTRTLLIAALTGTSVPILLAGGAVAWERLHELVPADARSWVTKTLAQRGAAIVLALVVLLLVLALVVGITMTALRLAQFTLVREPGRLRIHRGLLSQRSGTITVDRVQAVRVVEGLLRRVLGYCSLEVEVAGIGRRDETDRTLFPLVRRSQAHDLVARALPELRWTDGPLTPVEPQVRRRYLTLPVGWSLVPTALGLLLPGWWALLAVPWLPIAVLVGSRQGAEAAWALDEHTVTLRFRRILARHTVVARVHRVQRTELTRSWFQRRSELSAFRIRLSSNRAARLRSMPLSDAEHLQRVVGRRVAILAARRPPVPAEVGQR